jgi:hypothetical protein
LFKEGFGGFGLEVMVVDKGWLVVINLDLLCLSIMREEIIFLWFLLYYLVNGCFDRGYFFDGLGGFWLF